jgi:AcrR family transcriptional regulator
MGETGDHDCKDKKCARDRILAAARELFYQEGIRAVGIDTVIEKAGVAKMSLYRAFPSKDALVAAFLEDVDRTYWQWWDEVMARHPGSPRTQLTDLFQSLARFTGGPRFRGCPFVNTCVEFPDPAHPGRVVAAAHSAELRRRLTELCARAGAARPESLTEQLILIMKGAYTAGNAMEGEGPLLAVAEAAEALINAAIPPQRTYS